MEIPKLPFLAVEDGRGKTAKPGDGLATTTDSNETAADDGAFAALVPELGENNTIKVEGAALGPLVETAAASVPAQGSDVERASFDIAAGDVSLVAETREPSVPGAEAPSKLASLQTIAPELPGTTKLQVAQADTSASAPSPKTPSNLRKTVQEEPVRLADGPETQVVKTSGRAVVETETGSVASKDLRGVDDIAKRPTPEAVSRKVPAEEQAAQNSIQKSQVARPADAPIQPVRAKGVEDREGLLSASKPAEPSSVEKVPVATGGAESAAAKETLQRRGGAAVPREFAPPPSADRAASDTPPLSADRAVSDQASRVSGNNAPIKFDVSTGPRPNEPDPVPVTTGTLRTNPWGDVSEPLEQPKRKPAQQSDPPIQTKATQVQAAVSSGAARVFDGKSASPPEREVRQARGAELRLEGAQPAPVEAPSAPKPPVPDLAKPAAVEAAQIPEFINTVAEQGQVDQGGDHDILRFETTAREIQQAQAQATQRAEYTRPQAVATQIAEGAKLLREGQVEITLYPEELGRVRLTMTPSEAGMAVSLIAERPETLDLMRRHIDLLAEELSQQGFESLSFDFSGSGDTASGHNETVFSALTDLAEQPDPDPVMPVPLRMAATGLDLRL